MSSLITFTSRASADVQMLPDTAKYLLGILGKSLGERGVITAAEIPAALARLEAAMAAGHEHDDKPAGAPPLYHAGYDEHPETVRVDQRAWPMREMLRESLAAGADVLWGV